MAKIPKWVHTFVATERFHTLCDHPNESDEARKRIYFCVSCPRGPFCESESASKHDPAQHTVIPVWKNGEFSVVPAQDIEKFLNLHDIEQYPYREVNTVYIRARLEGKFFPEAKWFCVFCRRRLFDAGRFCSIFCKMTSIMEDPNSPDTLVP